jgi:hypothetical protein
MALRPVVLVETQNYRSLSKRSVSITPCFRSGAVLHLLRRRVLVLWFCDRTSVSYLLLGGGDTNGQDFWRWNHIFAFKILIFRHLTREGEIGAISDPSGDESIQQILKRTRGGQRERENHRLPRHAQKSDSTIAFLPQRPQQRCCITPHEMSLESLSVFPLDPLDDLPPLTAGGSSVGFSLDSAATQASFEIASRELLHQRPMLPHSEMNVVRIRPKKSPPKKPIQSALGSEINQHKLEQLPPKSDPYELVKLCRQGWTLSKVCRAFEPPKLVDL